MSTKLGVTENFFSSLYLFHIQSFTLKSVLSTVLTALATLLHVYIYIYIYICMYISRITLKLFTNEYIIYMKEMLYAVRCLKSCRYDPRTCWTI